MFAGNAPQFSFTMAWPACALRRCNCSAKTSFPTPLSPVSNTFAIVGATRAMSCSTSRIRRLIATGASCSSAARSFTCNCAFSLSSFTVCATSACCSSARAQRTINSSTAYGFGTK